MNKALRMKKIVMALVGIGFLISTAWAESKIKAKAITLSDGRTVENALLWKKDETEANYSYKSRTSSGFGILKMSTLPDDLQKSLGYDPKKDMESLKNAEALKKAAKETAARNASLPELNDVAIRVQTASSGRKETKSWETDYGSFNKSIDQNRKLTINLRNRTDIEGNIMLEVIWLTNGADGKGLASGVSSISREVVSLKPRAEMDVEVSKGFSRDHDKYVALGLSFQSGSGYAGWLARVVQTSTGKVLEVAANSAPDKKWSEVVPVLKSR